MTSLISSLAWVKRGISLQHPVKYDLDDDELKRISSIAKIELEDAKTELERADKAAEGMVEENDDEEGWEDEKSDVDGEDMLDDDEDRMDQDSTHLPKKKDPNDLSEYKLDKYDEEETATSLFSNIKGLTYYKSIDEDPHIILKDVDAEEREELEIFPTDNVIISARTEDEMSYLDVYVYDESQEDLYVHHDIMLSSFPLCLEWLDFHSNNGTQTPPNPTGNYIALGTMEPEIEVWSLDILDAIYPATILGRPDLTKEHTPLSLGTGKKKRKKTQLRGISTEYHVDAVLGLSWNKSHRNLLASASADTTIKLWDLTRATSKESSEGSTGSLRSFQVHSNKVQCIRWNDKEPSVLLSGSYDRTVRTFDSRAPEKGLVAVHGAEIEAICWDAWETHSFFVSLENGLVLCYDARTLPSDSDSMAKPRFTLAAHDGAVSALDINPHVRGCMVTGGTDKLVKVWNIIDSENTKMDVSLITSRDLGVGRVFSALWSPDDPLTIAAAGSTGKLQIWDVAANAGARKALSDKLHHASIAVKERSNGGIIGVSSDHDDSGDED